MTNDDCLTLAKALSRSKAISRHTYNTDIEQWERDVERIKGICRSRCPDFDESAFDSTVEEE